MKRIISTCLLIATLALPSTTYAGSSTAGEAILPLDQVAAFSNRVQQDLAARGVRVALVGRVGRDPAQLPDDISYTHVGLWVYSRITSADGSTGMGYQVYNLYQQAGDSTRSDLVQDRPVDFFSGAHVLDAGIIIPDPRLQTKLLNVIASPTYQALHNPQYAALSNPNTNQFQNCTEHTLNVLMAALYDTNEINQIKANIQAYFAPQVIQVNGLQRAFAPVASGALTTADHGATVATATFGSIARFMQANDLDDQVYRITPTQIVRF